MRAVSSIDECNRCCLGAFHQLPQFAISSCSNSELVPFPDTLINIRRKQGGTTRLNGLFVNSAAVLQQLGAWVDYSVGSFVAYGPDPEGRRIGSSKEGVVTADTGSWQFRIDGANVYVGSSLIGVIQEGVARTVTSANFLFRLEAE